MTDADEGRDPAGRGRVLGPFEIRLVPADDPTADVEIFAAIGGALLIAAAFALPLEAIAAVLGGCRFKSVVGLPCMTCGATRAVVALSRFDFGSAFRYQPLIACVAAIAGLYTPVAWASWLFGLPRLRISATSRRAFWWLVVCGGTIMLANWAFLVIDGR